MRTTNVLIALACAVCIGVAGCSQPAGAKSAGAMLADGASAVRLRATIYELRVPAAKIAALDAAQLAKADFAGPLPEFGDAKTLYRVDQSVDLSGDRILLGTEQPTVTNTRVTDRGQRVNTVEYRSTGAIIDFKAERLGPHELRVTSTIEMSAQTQSPVQIAEGVSRPVIRKVSMSLKGSVKVGEPAVLISADAATPDSEGMAVFYITRLVVGPTGS